MGKIERRLMGDGKDLKGIRRRTKGRRKGNN